MVDDTRQRLLAAATEVFARKGFRDATVREICQAAGANIAAVNYHFGDKQRLYIEAVKSVQLGRAGEVPMPDWNADTRPERMLHDFVHVMLVRILRDPREATHFQLMVHELSQPTEACVELVRDFIRPHFELLLSIIDRLAPADLPLESRQLIAFSIVGQCLYHRVARPIIRLVTTEEQYSRHTPERLAEHITAFSLAALGHGALDAAAHALGVAAKRASGKTKRKQKASATRTRGGR
ncbi:MAG: CerR family C-terminal domain-containing protein [Planctomycetes bacterium]|nr:CerR family C-terminal domain-containing protein [Planctomycetota bacterium]